MTVALIYNDETIATTSVSPNDFSNDVAVALAMEMLNPHLEDELSSDGLMFIAGSLAEKLAWQLKEGITQLLDVETMEPVWFDWDEAMGVLNKTLAA